jgi:hypothetical protein
MSMVLAAGIATIAAADDPAAQPPLTEQVERLIGPRATTTEPGMPAVQIASEMRQAGVELRSGESEAAVARQREILKRLDELLSTVPPKSSEQLSDGSASGEAAGVSNAPSGEPGTATGGTQSGAALESKPGAGGTPGGVPVLERRRNLATAVWGHLPDREREQMLQAYDAEYLPDYADLVEQYYETLAAQRLRTRGPAAATEQFGQPNR